MEGKATDYTALERLGQEKETLEAQLDAKMERWVYLNDLAERIAAQ
jgi:ATP-binding cassette subfamily F protein uup